MGQVRFLSKTDVESLIDFENTIDVVAEAFAAHQEGDTLLPPVLNMYMGKVRGELHIKSAYVESMNLISTKLITAFYHNPQTHNLPVGMGFIFLADGNTGLPLAVMDSSCITFFRTGASGALGIKHLARQNTCVGAMIGAGTNARYQLRGLAHFRKMKEVRVFDINRDAAKRFAREMAEELMLNIVVFDGPRDAVEGADVVITCTPATSPIIRKDWISPGTHINAMGADCKEKQELEESLFEGAKIVVDNKNQCLEFGECGKAVANGIIAAKDIYAEIGELTAMKKPGRADEDEVTIYDATGVAIQDLAAASLVYRRAEERSVGQLVDL
jgi:alanine dehydrogenase